MSEHSAPKYRGIEQHGIRVCLAIFFLIAPAFGPSYGFDHLGATSIWSRFWLGVWSAAALVVLAPVIVWGRVWLRVIAALLAILSAFGLFEAFRYLSFKG